MKELPKNFLNQQPHLVPAIMEMQRLIVDVGGMSIGLHDYVNSKAYIHIWETTQALETAQVSMLEALIVREFFSPKDYDSDRREWHTKKNEFFEALKAQIIWAVKNSDEPDLAESLFK